MARGTGTVTVIGLGFMGAALARAFGNAGHQLTVWNRSVDKAMPFRESAQVAGTVRDAVAASDTVVVSLLDYNAANRLLRTADVEATIAGRTVVQLTTGTPADARDSEAWAKHHDAGYLDGAMRAYPGTVDATLAVHTAAISQIVRASRQAGIDSTFPEALHDTYARAVAGGHGGHDLPALYEAFTPD